jgi:hypothetical protein
VKCADGAWLVQVRAVKAPQSLASADLTLGQLREALELEHELRKRGCGTAWDTRAWLALLGDLEAEPPADTVARLTKPAPPQELRLAHLATLHAQVATLMASGGAQGGKGMPRPRSIPSRCARR